MKKLLSVFLILILSVSTLVGCNNASISDTKTVKLGVTGEEHEIWDLVKEKLAKEDINLEIISFSDYIKPNIALDEGEIDINAFQHHAYLDNFNNERNLKLVSIGDTVFAPMAIYAGKLKSLEALKVGSKIAVPNDATNLGRALILLQNAGLIKLKDTVGLLPTIKDIADNPKNLEILELTATQIPRSLQDVDVAVINSGVAVDAKLSPTKDSLFIEDSNLETSKPYINLIAAKEENKNNEIYKKVVKVYQSEEVKEAINKRYKGESIPAF
ncbi:MetQ/NlpA family ABC transporter substrate-binding protein [Romboutsia lituseburensis]|uniref:MetQ/NlpA family ABC transporter substrate-binding protein n=1 Tax=Romboutsia lituseburensis TaxID=1537 RepID=UPI00215ABB2D|nr:MetQ/NlpA family ABC transporter substrate-binding protein [Romboutsia lituseburensis]MCR8747026.1 MetQ/NlpA family ABC transporter substrate-binding protein [Romboutsia lituseburensis]